jgi:hypothetical protein
MPRRGDSGEAAADEEAEPTAEKAELTLAGKDQPAGLPAEGPPSPKPRPRPSWLEGVLLPEEDSERRGARGEAIGDCIG